MEGQKKLYATIIGTVTSNELFNSVKLNEQLKKQKQPKNKHISQQEHIKPTRGRQNWHTVFYYLWKSTHEAKII